jgi:hypothetical protein
MLEILPEVAVNLAASQGKCNLWGFGIEVYFFCRFQE